MNTNEILVSVVMPCLNEENTIQICIEKAKHTMEEMGVYGEVVVSDNGSSDRSVEFAESCGARVVHESIPGYGSAYLKGLGEAQGRFIVMGDSDNTYDFNELERFVTPLQEGYDMVMGNRFKGGIQPGAMPWHHQHIGNPILSGILNTFFHTGIGDAHCGMRSFTKEAFQKMHLKTRGMEFASEMVIHSAKAKLRITEVPVIYSPRPENSQAKLRSFRDGWRHLRFMLLYSPTHLFLIPGSIIMILGILIMGALAFGPVRVGNLFFGFHWMFVGCLLTLLGFQIIQLSIIARFYSLTSHFDDNIDPILKWIKDHFNLESGIILGLVVFGIGLLFDFLVLINWINGNFQSPDAIRFSIIALTLSIIGAQIIFSTFLISMLSIRRHGWGN